MRKINISSFAVFLMLLLLSVMPVQVSAEEESYSGYCLDRTGEQLESINYGGETDPNNVLSSMVTWLNERHSSTTGEALFPEGVEITSYEIAEGALTLSFSASYSEMGRVRELLVRAGTVKMLLQPEEISAVQFQIEGSPILDSKGAEIGFMNTETFIDFSSSDQEAYRYDTFTLYFSNEEGTALVPETRTVYYRRSIPKARVALEQLIRGPIEEKRYAVLSSRTELITILEEDDVCYADFDQTFLTRAPEGVSSEVIVASVVNTLIDATDVTGVEISVNRESDLMYRDEISLYNFFTWNEDLISKEES